MTSKFKPLSTDEIDSLENLVKEVLSFVRKRTDNNAHIMNVLFNALSELADDEDVAQLFNGTYHLIHTECIANIKTTHTEEG